MSEKLHEKFWTDIVAEVQVGNQQPLGRDDIDVELQSGEDRDLTEERVSKILDFTTAKDSVLPTEVHHVGVDRDVACLLGEVSSSGLVSQQELSALDEASSDATRLRSVRDYMEEFARRNLLRTYQPQRPEQELEKGVLFGDYLLLDRIGVGGMGEVFRALHVRMNRIVALKVVSSQTPRRNINLQRFEREVEVLAKLKDPHIVTAYDAGELGNVPYLAMEYVDGSDLAQLIGRIGPLAPTLAIGYLIQAARGLECAHSQGVIHRDVKPSNILVDSDGTVKISDLGLAKLVPLAGRVDRAFDTTMSGIALGTCSYMSPEQAIGDEAGVPSDIYGFGCTLFFLLVGRSPAEGSTSEAKLLWHREGVVPSLRTFVSVSPRLDTIFQRMLAKSPADRPQSMTEVIRDLEACQPEPKPKPEPEPKPVGESRSHALWWLVLLGVGLVAAVPMGLLLSGFFDPDPTPVTLPVVPTQPPKEFTSSIGMQLTAIPTGEFLMGAPEGEQGSHADERPQHLVRIKRAFYIGKFEVNQRQYNLVMDPSRPIPEWKPGPGEPAAVDPGALPVVNVTWDDAARFCRLLSRMPEEQRHGRTYRLPTEAEWEYCCRADTVTAFSTGKDITKEQANFGPEHRPPDIKFPGAPRLLEVGSFPPNPFGLHDMHGNALEWCSDRYGEYHPDAVTDPDGTKDGNQHVLRGGATMYDKNECRSAHRRYKRPNETNQFTGFRVVCEIKAK